MVWEAPLLAHERTVSAALVTVLPCTALPVYCPALPRTGTIAGGRDAANALALYGMHLAPVPSANEQVEGSGMWGSPCQYMPVHFGTTGSRHCTL